MEFSVTETVAAARDDVVRALASPGYYESLGDASTSVRAPELLSASTSAGRLHTRVRYAFAGTITGPAARFVDERKLTWVIDTTYDTSAHRGHLVVEPDHYHALLRCSGTLVLDEVGATTTETLSGRLEVRIPLVGGSAEQAVLAGFTTQLALEAAALGAWCAAHPT